jgi:hypothetical protein
MNKKSFAKILMLPALMLLAACGSSAHRADVMVETTPELHPDYAGVTFPPNIAAPTFRIQGDSTVTEYQTEIGRCGHDPQIVIVSRDSEVRIPMKQWRSLMAEAKGDSIYMRFTLMRNGRREQSPDVVCPVSRDSIDRYLSYRLIYPGYELWAEMGIYQRDLTSYEQTPILENKDFSIQCVNCHNYSANRPDRGMMVHVRGPQGGTLIDHGGATEKINARFTGMAHGATYPAYAPNGRFIAFSANDVMQVFHASGTKPIEVVDCGADLMVYDVESHRAYTSPLVAGPEHMETFPTWTPDCRRLYFCRGNAFSDSLAIDSLRYDLYCIDFNPQTGEFANLQCVYDATADGHSVSFPRVSPDGRWLMFTRSNYGNFSIWHPEAQLCIMDLTTGSWRELSEVNSDNIESYHSWSSNGRWFVFSSKRMDGLWARPFIAAFDPQTGRASRPLPVPQKSADFYDDFTRTYNIPELTVTAPAEAADRLLKGITEMNATPVQAVRK